MAQQTAVEFLVSKLPLGVKGAILDKIEQANKMFEEQITNAYKAKTGSNPRHPTIQEFFDKQAKQYYNETYKK